MSQWGVPYLHYFFARGDETAFFLLLVFSWSEFELESESDEKTLELLLFPYDE